MLDGSIYPVRLTDWLDSLPAYDANPGNAMLLELARKVMEEPLNYYWQGVVLPPRRAQPLGGRANFEAEIAVVPGTYVTSIGGYSSEPEGFAFQIYDTGSRLPFGNRFLLHRVIAPSEGQGWILGPLPVMDTGKLNIQITNLSSSSSFVQLFLALAVPVGGAT